MKDKLKELELQLNYVCYEKEMITKLQSVWRAYFELQEKFEKLNKQNVSGSVCCRCGELGALEKYGMCQKCIDFCKTER